MVQNKSDKNHISNRLIYTLHFQDAFRNLHNIARNGNHPLSSNFGILVVYSGFVIFYPDYETLFNLPIKNYFNIH